MSFAVSSSCYAQSNPYMEVFHFLILENLLLPISTVKFIFDSRPPSKEGLQSLINDSPTQLAEI